MFLPFPEIPIAGDRPGRDIAQRRRTVNVDRQQSITRNSWTRRLAPARPRPITFTAFIEM